MYLLRIYQTVCIFTSSAFSTCMYESSASSPYSYKQKDVVYV